MSADIDRAKEKPLRRAFSAVLGGFLAFFALVAMAWLLRGLLSPVVVGFLLASVFNPLVNRAEERWHWPRLLTVSLLLLLSALVVAAVAVWLVPLALAQIGQFMERLPDYLDKLLRVFHRGTLSEEIRTHLTEAAKKPDKVLPLLLRGAAKSVGIVAATFGALTYVGVYLMLLLVFFIAFSVHMAGIKAWCRQFLPRSHRDEILTTVHKISDAAGIYLRTRLVLVLIVGALFSAGWAIAGVPYWLLFGMAAGVLNIVPFAVVVAWLAVLLVSALGADSARALLYALLWPTVVYVVVQFLDGWVFSPLLQGGKLHIHPVIVLFAIVAGGAVAGILGMFIAIPLVAAWQICFADVIKPRLIDWADAH